MIRGVAVARAGASTRFRRAIRSATLPDLKSASLDPAVDPGGANLDPPIANLAELNPGIGTNHGDRAGARGRGDADLHPITCRRADPPHFALRDWRCVHGRPGRCFDWY